MKRLLTLHLVLLVMIPIRQSTSEEDLHTIDLGSPGDEEFILDGFHQREGPYPESSMPLAAHQTFRWTAGEFSLSVPVFPETHNRITFIMHLDGGMRLSINGSWERVVFGTGRGNEKYSVLVPAAVVGDVNETTLHGSSLRKRSPAEGEGRVLFALIDRVIIEPLDEIPEEEVMEKVPSRPEIPTLDRIRGVERRPATGDPDEFVQYLLHENANVVTMGAMYGSGYLFFPSEYGTPHPQMDPTWLPSVITELRAHDIRPLCWVVFNAQDMRSPDELVPTNDHPEWTMKYIEEPDKDHSPKAGMCVIASPYIGHHARVLREAAAFDFDGFFFDGFYFGGIPHPARPGCVCKFCEEAFAEDTGLEIPKVVDWTDMTFKRWVRWRNEKLLENARFLQAEMRKVNPDITCTFNYNIWPFGGKDWETAIPMWRIDDFGVSQHGYTPKFFEKWMMLGFKCRIGRDMNPAHTDVWRACGFQHTCRGEEPDVDWHELEIKTFILAALSHGITPWHSGVAGPVELTGRIHADAAKRERYFSRDYIANVGVLCSQNTHDFYGHIPETNNLNNYRDSLIGTWMILTESHIPFEYVFDNRIEERVPDHYEVLILPKAAALSNRAAGNIVDWVEAGGRLIVTGDTGEYDEWGTPRTESLLAFDFGLDTGIETDTRSIGGGRVTRLHEDPGVAYCRDRNTDAARDLIAGVPESSLPFSVDAPPWLVINMFRDPGGNELWVHFLNVSHLMPDGDSGFRGLERPPVPAGDVPREDQAIDPASRSVGAPLAPVHDIRFRLNGQEIDSAHLVVADEDLPVEKNTEVVIPEIQLHDVLVLRPAR